METGLDRLVHSPELQRELCSSRFALVAHPASVTRDLVHISEVLAQVGARPQIVFGPEHGYGGEAQDMIGVGDARDARGVPVRSLYGPHFGDLSPTREDLDGLDLVVIDLQDVGARYYTFIWTAVLVLRACMAARIRVCVLDRPNPLGADDAATEGRAQDPGFRSFVGLEPLPIRHGLTLGEIVAWRAEAEGMGRDLLRVVGCEGVSTALQAPAWDRPFVMPSPNMPTFDTALVYPGGCLLEGTNLSEGRGTTRPFEICGAPWLDGGKLARAAEELALPGLRARPLTFQPTFQKFAGKVCGGIEVHVTDARTFRPVEAYLAIIALARQQNPALFEFRTERYEFVDDIPAFDLLTGSPAARMQILAGSSPREVARGVAEVSSADREIVRAARAAMRSVAI